MKSEPGSFKISYTIFFNWPIGKATLNLRHITKIEKIKIKFALKDELDKLVTFEELIRKYEKLPIPKEHNPCFFVINEETGERAKIVIPMPKIWPPNARGDTTVDTEPIFLDISGQISKIGG